MLIGLKTYAQRKKSDAHRIEKENLQEYHCPNDIIFLKTFPTTHTGKLSRNELINLVIANHI